MAEPAAPSPLAPRTATLPSPGGRPAGAGTAPLTAESRPSRIPGVELAIGVGAAVPTSPAGFSELFDPGFALTLDVTRHLRGILGLRVDFGHARTSLAGADLNIDFTRYGGGITLAPFGRESRGTPYGFFTVGGVTTDARGDDAPNSAAETDFGIGLGGGYRWLVGERWGIGGDVRGTGVFGGSGDEGGDDDGPVWYVTPSVAVFIDF